MIMFHDPSTTPRPSLRPHHSHSSKSGGRDPPITPGLTRMTTTYDSISYAFGWSQRCSGAGRRGKAAFSCIMAISIDVSYSRVSGVPTSLPHFFISLFITTPLVREHTTSHSSLPYHMTRNV